jgi:hypothetical protein
VWGYNGQRLVGWQHVELLLEGQVVMSAAGVVSLHPFRLDLVGVFAVLALPSFRGAHTCVYSLL